MIMACASYIFSINEYLDTMLNKVLIIEQSNMLAILYDQ